MAEQRGRIVVAGLTKSYGAIRAADGLSFTAGSCLPATMAGGVIAVAIFALIGVALGALIRDQVASVVSLLIYLYVVDTVLTRIPALADWTMYLPGPAGSALSGIALTNQEFLPAWQGALVLLGYAIVLAAAGGRLTVRRDIA